MRNFQLNRTEDISGISGVGIVAEGVEFSNGRCVVSWLTKYTSIVVYDNIETVIAIHSHDGGTKIEYTTLPEVTSHTTITTDAELQLRLTPREYSFYRLLADNSERVVTHAEIAFKLWNETDERLAATMTPPLCKKVRDKLGSARIVTVRGRGYILG